MQCIPSSLLKFSPIDKEDHWLSCSLEGWKKWIGLPIYHRVIDCSITFLALFLLKNTMFSFSGLSLLPPISIFNIGTGVFMRIKIFHYCIID